MDNLLNGFVEVLTPMNLLYILIGVLVGMIIGIIPGLGSISGMALLFPLAFQLDPVPAVAMLAAVYYGTQYGGTIGAILVNMPGGDTAVAATFDGYPLAKQGRAGPALLMQAIGSFVGGTASLVLLGMFAPLGAKFASALGPPEFLMLILLALVFMTGIAGADKFKALISAFVGFAIATVGVDLITGESRMTFGSADLISGLDIVPVTIGLFAIGEVLTLVATGMHRRAPAKAKAPLSLKPTRDDWLRTRFSMIRGTLVGFFLGSVPGVGATVASLSAYSIEKQVSKHPEQFGKGAMEGLVAPESANNAASSGSMLPLLSLGIPGSAATAMLLTAFLVIGLQPGPLLMTENPQFAWGVIASMYLGNIFLVVMSILGIPLFARVVRIRFAYIGPVVVIIATISAYLNKMNFFDVWIMLGCGLIGYFMTRFGYSPALLVIGMVLGPIAETSLRQSLIVSEGSLSIFLTRPFALGIGIAIIALVAVQIVMPLVRSRRRTAVALGAEFDSTTPAK